NPIAPVESDRASGNISDYGASHTGLSKIPRRQGNGNPQSDNLLPSGEPISMPVDRASLIQLLPSPCKANWPDLENQPIESPILDLFLYAALLPLQGAEKADTRSRPWY